MFTLLTIALWIGGLAIILAGHMVAGAAIAAAGVLAAVKAVERPDDLERAAGIAFGFVIVTGAARLAVWAFTGSPP